MRLREPFEGYKLAQGHFMFHIAFLIGSIISTRHVLTEEELMADEKALDTLFDLNIAHVVVPVFNFIIIYSEAK